MSATLPKSPRFWIGDAPMQCQVCHRPLGKSFIDGRFSRSSTWAIFDLRCHRQFGAGLGAGVGQMYRLQDDRRWLKVEG